MAGVTQDIQMWPVSPDTQLAVPYGVGASQTVYHGCIALVSGSGATTVGYLKNAATAGAADLVAGIVDTPSGGTYVQTGPGIVGGTTDGSVWVDVRTGTFLMQSGTGADQLVASGNGTVVYYGGESASGPIACATSAGSTRPKLGIQLPQDPSQQNGSLPGSNYWPIKLNQIGGPST
jgi:hypothetical protein